MSFTKEQVLKELKSEGVAILSLLPREAYAKLHIKHSVNLPWTGDGEAFAREAERRFGRDKLLILHAAGPGSAEAGEAARCLKGKGLKAEDYPGGLEEWHDNGLPVDEAPVPA